MHFLPISLLISLHFLSLAWAQVTLAPPSTFPSASQFSVGSTTPSGSSSASGSINSSTPTSSAQFPILSGFSSCVTTCLSLGVAAANCSSVTEVDCYCGKRNFTSEIVSCISQQCPTEITTAEDLSQRFCNVASSSRSLSFPPTPSSTPAPSSSSSSTSSVSSLASSTSTTDTASSSAPANNGAAGRLDILGATGQGTVLGLAMMAVGILLGACIVE
ncbi:hypothetical protein BDQ12DRAFT_690307 [Crucibulum laeve]|uniref:CFEM domain-containing protein n=1 Tax=Crucibulum laeve TaxID=68775 RepID=A0A5C3LNZ6_9AGAR|nr:hypothetical protein BDQ12DRAFT_690307 [Crucibulum laeve]